MVVPALNWLFLELRNSRFALVSNMFILHLCVLFLLLKKRLVFFMNLYFYYLFTGSRPEDIDRLFLLHVTKLTIFLM